MDPTVEETRDKDEDLGLKASWRVATSADGPILLVERRGTGEDERSLDVAKLVGIVCPESRSSSL